MLRFGQPYAPELAQPSLNAPIPAGAAPPRSTRQSVFLQPLTTYGQVYGDAEWWYNQGEQTLSLPGVDRRQALTLSGSRTEEVGALVPFDIPANPQAVDLLTPLTPDAAIADPLAGRDPLTGRMISPEEAALAGEKPALPEEAAPSAVPQPVPFSPIDEPAALQDEVPLFAPRGADVYRDMLAAQEFVAAAREHADDIRAVTAARPTLADQYSEAMSAAQSLMDKPLETYAGTRNSAVQNYLSKAEDLLHQGDYYQARSLYERARNLDRHNPLILIGQGQAMIAAGEYYSAAHAISRAVELFPGIAFFKFDLTKFITEPDLLERRRADLERRLENKEDYRFRFVLGYAEYYSGLQEYGLENLRKAAEQAPPHSGIARLYELLKSKAKPTQPPPTP
jgi:tetratricopeptide (TPR) repeat protein